MYDANLSTILGSFAGVLSMVSMVPQLIKTVHMKETRDISFRSYALLSLATFLWFVYGLFRQDVSLMLTNTFSFSCAASMVILKTKYK